MSFLFSSTISADGVEQLKQYRYQGEDHSLLTKYVMRHYWTLVASLLPSWLAYVFLFGVVCLRAVQTLDAIDGKQARATGTSSPLGEMFDHGCDAVNTGFIVLMLIATLQLGAGLRTLILFVISYVAFAISTWEEHETHILRLGYVNAPTEGLLLNAVLLIFTGIVGPSFWTIDLSDFAFLSWLPIRLNAVVFLVLIVVALVHMVDSLYHVHLFHNPRAVLTHDPSDLSQFQFSSLPLDVDSQRSPRTTRVHQIPLLDRLGPIVPLLIVAGLCFFWCLIDPVFWQFPHLPLITIDLIIANLVSRVILARLTSDPVKWINLGLVPLPFLLVNAFLSLLPFTSPFLNGYLFCTIAVVWATVSYLWFWWDVISIMSRHLHCAVFTIPTGNALPM